MGVKKGKRICDILIATLMLISVYYFINSIGSDEVGTGDYFGPIIVCASYVNRKDISQILICYDNENVKMGYVNLSNDNYNKNQINALSDNRLYITIEDE